MKLYNNSQKTPQSESLHKVKQNCKTPRQKWRYTQQIEPSAARRRRQRYGRKKHPKQLYKVTEKSSTHKLLKQAVDIHEGN